MPLYLLRHGETEFNVAGRFQGQNDSPLTTKGKAQAQQNAMMLNGLIADKSALNIIASPLRRTIKTTQIICKTLGIDSKRIKTDERLKEIHFGDWQGLTKQEIKYQYPGQWHKRNLDPDNYLIPGGGENFKHMYARIDAWLDETRAFWESNETWLVISHGTTGSVIRGRYLGLNVFDIRNLTRRHDWFFEVGSGKVVAHKQENA